MSCAPEMRGSTRAVPGLPSDSPMSACARASSGAREGNCNTIACLLEAFKVPHQHRAARGHQTPNSTGLGRSTSHRAISCTVSMPTTLFGEWNSAVPIKLRTRAVRVVERCLPRLFPTCSGPSGCPPPGKARRRSWTWVRLSSPVRAPVRASPARRSGNPSRRSGDCSPPSRIATVI